MEVRFYSGSRADERPVSIVIGGEEKPIVEILKQAVEEDAVSGKKRRVFRVRIEDGRVYAVVETEGRWAVQILEEGGAPKEGSEEASLVRSALDGSERAYARLMRLHKVSVYNLAIRMVGDSDDAADLTQEAFIRAFRALARFDPEYPFRPWVLKIASNICLDFLRKRRPDTVSTEEAEVMESGNGPPKQLERRRMKTRLEEAVKALPENLRAAVILRHQEGMSYEEIAEALEVPMGTVKTWIRRGREILKSRLKE